MHDLLARPRSAWRRITLDGVSRLYRTPRILDALSSAVVLKVNRDIQLTLMASSLYRHLGQIDKQTICVHFQKRAHNPLLVAAGFDKLDTRIPWLGNRRLQFVFG